MPPKAGKTLTLEDLRQSTFSLNDLKQLVADKEKEEQAKRVAAQEENKLKVAELMGELETLWNEISVVDYEYQVVAPVWMVRSKRIAADVPDDFKTKILGAIGKDTTKETIANAVSKPKTDSTLTDALQKLADEGKIEIIKRGTSKFYSKK